MARDINRDGVKKAIRCFVIMPFSKEFTKIWEIIEEVCVKEGNVKIERADKHVMEVTITENIFKHIDDSDITVIDVSDLNSNVLFEFGYAAARKKYIIPITQGEIKSLPTDLRSYIFLSYDKEQYDNFRIDLRNRLREELDRINRDREIKLLEAKTLIVKSSFEVECFVNRDEANLRTVFANAQNEIKVLQTNMATVVAKYIDAIKTALDTNSDLSVLFLALDPESYFAAGRANQLGRDVSEFRNELHESLFDLYTTFRRNDRVEIRIYDDFPTQISFIVDNTIYNCVVSKYQPSRNNCIFKLSDRFPTLHTSFVLHFTSVWRDKDTTRKYTPLTHRTIPKSDD